MNDANNYRLPGGVLQNTSGGNYQTHYECRIAGRDLNDPEVLTPMLFMNNRDTLRAGDAVTICNYADQNYDAPTARLLQMVTLRIVSKDDKGVRFIDVGGVVDIPFEKDEPRPEVIEKAWAKRGAPGTGFNVLDRDGNILGNHKTKVEAEEQAARINAGGTA